MSNGARLWGSTVSCYRVLEARMQFTGHTTASMPLSPEQKWSNRAPSCIAMRARSTLAPSERRCNAQRALGCPNGWMGQRRAGNLQQDRESKFDIIVEIVERKKGQVAPHIATIVLLLRTATISYTMASAPICINCVTGFKLPGTPKGNVQKLGPYDTYIAGNGGSHEKAIVLFTDAFGLGLDNNKIIADMIAERTGFPVFVPDVRAMWLLMMCSANSTHLHSLHFSAIQWQARPCRRHQDARISDRGQEAILFLAHLYHSHSHADTGTLDLSQLADVQVQ